ncbi:methyl-accepting chemotaxis protein [uncultured Selenomonas sp.]|uniref:methyl-accepting chemotaxis protein n=1 Tax=uncultured Selenomonas sp. TaxID=159275 RepID=UPI002676F975|nr:methyl-accepting chemotaxis protein [uncultured Selenomonas sp.]
MALIGWESANSGFNSALQTQAVLNVKLIFENMDVRYPGDWSLQDGKLYKGDHRFGDNQVVADKLGEICQGHVTFFAEDVSVSTNLKKANGERNVGTKASAEVADIVIKGNKEHSGMAAIDGIDYLGAYVPLRNASGQAIGMLFVGIGSYVMDDVRHQFLMVTVVASILVILILSVLSYVAIGRSLKPIEDLTESLGRIAKGDLRVADLDESREDEIGILAHSTNAMKNRLREVMSNVSRSAETVAASSEQLTASTQETLESITHVAQNTTPLAEGAAEQKDTADAVAAIRQGNENVDEGASVVASSGEAFRTVAENFTELGRNIRLASDEVGVVSKARDDMIESLKRVEDISRKAADDTQTISAAAEEQAAAMHEMADASNTLATLAQELQNEVQKFHL